MRRALLVLALAVTLGVVSGCATRRGLPGTCRRAPETCRQCSCKGDPRCPRCHGGGGQVADPGVGAASVAYPYYTIRGPRDFLAPAPPSIGP